MWGVGFSLGYSTGGFYLAKILHVSGQPGSTLKPLPCFVPCQNQDCQRGLPEGAPGAEPQPHRAGGCPHHEPPCQPHVRLHPEPEHGAAPSTDQKQHGCSQDSRHLPQPEQRGAAAGMGSSRPGHGEGSQLQPQPGSRGCSSGRMWFKNAH